MAWTGFSGRQSPAGPPGPDGDDQFGSQQEARVHSVILAMSVTYYPLGAQVMTLVLPLGFFIVVMAALYFVFARPRTVPGRRPISGARPVPPPGPGPCGLAARRDGAAPGGRGGRRRAAGRARRPAAGRCAHRG